MIPSRAKRSWMKKRRWLYLVIGPLGFVLGFLLAWSAPWYGARAPKPQPDIPPARAHPVETTLLPESPILTSRREAGTGIHSGVGLLLTPREIAQRSFLSVVFISLEYPKGQRISQGSGFVVKRGVVATNFHVIGGMVSGQVNLVGHKEEFPIRGVVAADLERDLVLLAVPDLDAPPLELAPDDDVAVGDKVFVVGNPNGLEGTFSDGVLSGRRDWKSSHLLQITAPISMGSSGSPVLDVHGRVIGIAKGSWTDGQNLNFAIPSALVKPMTEQTGEIQQLAQITNPKPRKRVAPPSRPESLLDKIRRWFHP